MAASQKLMKCDICIVEMQQNDTKAFSVTEKGAY